MDENQRDELLSAYLDGELEAADTARIEQLLSEDEQARETMEEMQAVRRALRALPRRGLDADFADGVIRRAERAVLSGAAATPSQGEPAAESASHVARHWRRFVWPLVAVAAAVLIAVNPGGFFPTSQQEPSLALQEENKSSGKAPAAKPSDVPVQPTGVPIVEKASIGAVSEKDADKTVAVADEQEVADPLAGDAADGAKAAPTAPEYLADTVYVYCDVSPNMSPREVVRQFESRYRGGVKANKFQQAASLAEANAGDYELNRLFAKRQRLSAVAQPEDAKGEKLARNNESPRKDSAPGQSLANEPQLVADDAGPQGEVRLVATMTDDQLQIVVGQLRAQQGWTVDVGGEDAGSVNESLAEEDPRQSLRRSGEPSRLSLDQKQDAPEGFGARSRKPKQAAEASAGQTPRFQAASPSPAGASARREAPKTFDVPKKGRGRSQRFKSSELDRLEAKLLGKDKKKLKAPAPADDSTNGKRDEDESYDRAVIGKVKSLDTATAELAQPAPPRRVVFIFRAAPAPQAEAASPAK